MGSFKTLPNADVEERGTMYNPETQQNEEYVEIWRRHFTAVGAAFFVLESKTDTGEFYLGRVGTRALGLGVTKAGEYVAWRADLVEGNWDVVFKQDQSGALPMMPSDPSWLKGTVMGDKITLRDREWVVKTVGSVAAA